MISFSNRFLAFWVSISSFRDSANEEINEKGDGARADKKYCQALSSVLIDLKNDCEKLELKSLVDRIDHFLIKLFGATLLTVVRSEIGTLLASLNNEVHQVKFAFIPKDVSIFFENESLFGDEVKKSFPSAAPHIKDAGNCIATDLNTAAVYHLMIAAEFGLRAIAKHLKVKIKRDLQYADWDEVIRAIDTRISKSRLHADQRDRKNLNFTVQL